MNIYDKKVLMVGSGDWLDPGELQLMAEMLSGANDLVWVSQYGGLRASLMPTVNVVKERLLVYYPGVNFLALPFLADLNERRRLLQVSMFLLEKDFEPDQVWIDHPATLPACTYYAKRGALTIYCPDREGGKGLDRVAAERLARGVGLVIAPTPRLFSPFRHCANAHLVESMDLRQAAGEGAESGGEGRDGSVGEDPAVKAELEEARLEKLFLSDLERRLDMIMELIDRAGRSSAADAGGGELFR